MTLQIDRLKERREFLAASRAISVATPGFVLQARRRNERDAERLTAKIGAEAAERARIGFTATKKVGNAVARNRAKRRLRALVDEIAPRQARPGWDYVLIARAGETADRLFASMREELVKAFTRAHDPKTRSTPHRGGGKRRHGGSRKRTK